MWTTLEMHPAGRSWTLHSWRLAHVLAMAPYITLIAVLCSAHGAAAVAVRFDESSVSGSPFPTNRYTVVDTDNLTGRRVALPMPDCASRKSDCEDMAILNKLDGFSTDPRISLPFTGPFDIDTATSRTIFLVNLGDVVSGHGNVQRIGINQRLWDANTSTMFFKPENILAESSEYALIVSDGLLDLTGKPVQTESIAKQLHRYSTCHDLDKDRECANILEDEISSVLNGSNGSAKYAVVSIFTTLSASADMFKILDDIKKAVPAAVNFHIGNVRTSRTVFSLDNIRNIQFLRQVRTTSELEPQLVSLAHLKAGNSVGKIAFGEYSSPSFLTKERYIPETATGIGKPHQQISKQLLVEMFIPIGKQPAGGWPVAIFGHPLEDSMYGVPWIMAPALASAGVATVAINNVGHGGGSEGKVVVTTADYSTVTFNAGGRGIDVNQDGLINNTEGATAAAPYEIVGFRDTLRQNVVDMLQLVQQIRSGIDVDGDGHIAFDANRVYYGGMSLGGFCGTLIMGIEPIVRVGVLNVPGASLVNTARLGLLRYTLDQILRARVPSILNLPQNSNSSTLTAFEENIPLRNVAIVVNNVPGALAVAEVLDRGEWVQQPASPQTYASFLRKSPPRGGPAKRILLQFVKGDKSVPNPENTALVRAGDLSDRSVFYRDDLVANVSKTGYDPHGFLVNILDPSRARYALQAQSQLATFLASSGLTTIDPDGAEPVFEVPIASPLPETLSFD